jgi:hypothetical protein
MFLYIGVSFTKTKTLYMMRKLLAIICAIAGFSLVSQAETQLTAAHVAQFFKTKTYVILDDNPLSDYNRKVQDAVKKHWKITGYEFATQTDFHAKRTDANCSFLILSEVVFSKDKELVKYDFFSLVLGGRYPNLLSMPVVGAVPLGYTGAPQETTAYKLGAMLKFLQAHVQLLQSQPNIIGDNLFKYYNSQQKSIKDKTLYLVKEELAPSINSKSKIAAHYPYKVLFVTRAELEAAIDRDEEGVVFLHKVGPEGTKRKARCYKVILGTDSQMYYFDFHMISDKKPDGLLEADLKQIAKFDK